MSSDPFTLKKRCFMPEILVNSIKYKTFDLFLRFIYEKIKKKIQLKKNICRYLSVYEISISSTIP